MARVDVKMPDEFLERMSRLGSNFDAIAETVLEAGGEVVLEKTKSNLSSVIAPSMIPAPPVSWSPLLA